MPNGAAIHLSRPIDTHRYPRMHIVVEDETEYGGETWVKSLFFTLFLVDSPLTLALVFLYRHYNEWG